MDDNMGRAAMYALEAIVAGMRDAGFLPAPVVDAIEERTRMGLNLAGAIDFKSAGFEPHESEAIRHGMWCAREFIAPSGGASHDTINSHPAKPQNWPTLEERRAFAARGFADQD